MLENNDQFEGPVERQADEEVSPNAECYRVSHQDDVSLMAHCERRVQCVKKDEAGEVD